MFLDFVRDNAAFSSAIAVAVGWFATRRGQIHSDRAKHSHSYTGFLEKSEQLPAIRLLAPYLNEARVFEDEATNPQAASAIWACLQDMEKAAIDIDAGYISEKYFYKKYKTFVERFFIVSTAFINQRRNESNSDTIYKNFESLYVRFRFSPRPYTLIIFEYIRVRPSFRASSSIFSSYLRHKGESFCRFLMSILRYHPLPRQINYSINTDVDLIRFGKWIKRIRRIEISVFAIIVLYYLF